MVFAGLSSSGKRMPLEVGGSNAIPTMDKGDDKGFHLRPVVG